jgi:hypothetical protein
MAAAQHEQADGVCLSRREAGDAVADHLRGAIMFGPDALHAEDLDPPRPIEMGRQVRRGATGDHPDPAATPDVADGECERGAVPTYLTIGPIDVDTEVEYTEIVDGLMEQPSGQAVVNW